MAIIPSTWPNLIPDSTGKSLFRMFLPKKESQVDLAVTLDISGSDVPLKSHEKSAGFQAMDSIDVMIPSMVPGRYGSDECGPSSERSPGETAVSGDDAHRLRQLLVHLDI